MDSNMKLEKASLGFEKPKLQTVIRRELKKNWLLFVMLVPAVTYVIIFSYWPMSGVILAFKDFKTALGIYGSPWNGLANFEFLYISGKLWQLTRNTLLYNAVFITVGIVLEVGFAVIISELIGKRVKKLFQSTMFLPYFISWVVVSAIVYNLLAYERGAINTLLVSLGFDRIDLYNSGLAYRILLPIVNAWKHVGYGLIVYLAAITSIDQEMYEAAKVDGANVWQRMFKITIPSLAPTMTILTLLKIGGIFRGDFGMFYQIVKQNAFVMPATDILDTYVFRSLIQTSNVGMSSAAGFYQSVLCFITICTANLVVKKIKPDYALF